MKNAINKEIVEIMVSRYQNVYYIDLADYLESVDEKVY